MKTLALVIASVLLLSASGAMADGDGKKFEAAITNPTRGQQFTPIFAAGHKKGVRLFELGAASSPELGIFAEEGSTAPLNALLAAMPEVKEVTDSGGLWIRATW